jgi:hypothetical protein
MYSLIVCFYFAIVILAFVLNPASARAPAGGSLPYSVGHKQYVI